MKLPEKTLPRTIIERKDGWQLINLKELREYKDLFYFLVWRDIKVLYKQTVLGFSWAIIRPVFSMMVFTIIFGRMAQIDSDGVPYPIFSYVALVPWTYFATSMTASTGSLVGGKAMLTKVYFPRLVFPMTPVIAKLVDFTIAFLIIGVLMIWYKITPTYNIVFLPLLVLLMMLTAAGIGMWLSALAIQYRDINHAIPFVAQLLMYAAPVVWSVTLIAERFGKTAVMVYSLYPMAGVITGFRAALLGTTPMPWNMIAIGSVSALFLAVSGAFYFKRMERIFADVA